jgi:hypothetical protein
MSPGWRPATSTSHLSRFDLSGSSQPELVITVLNVNYEPGSLRSDLAVWDAPSQIGPNPAEKHNSRRSQAVTFRAHLAGGRAPGAQPRQTGPPAALAGTEALGVAEVVLGASSRRSAAALADLLTWTRAGAKMPTFLGRLGSAGEVAKTATSIFNIGILVEA